ncbi:MAG: caspase family protein [Mucilaginibacter sp.]
MKLRLKYTLLCFVMPFVLLTAGYAQKIEITVKTGHEKDIVHASMSADETKLFTVDSDNFGILWDVGTGRQLRIFDHILNGVFTGNSQALLIADSYSTFKTIDLLGNTVKTFPGQPSGNNVLNNPSDIYPDQGLMIYHTKFININTGDIVKPQCTQYSSAAFAPSAGIVAIGGKDGNVAICDVKDGKWLKTIGLDFGASEHIIEFLNFAQDDNIFLAGCGETKNAIEIVDYAANKILRSVQYPRDLRFVTAAVLAPDGKAFIVVTEKNIDMVSVQTGKLVWQAPNTEHYSKASFYHSGGRIMLFGDMKHIGLVDAATGNAVQTISTTALNRLNAVTLSPDEKSLLSVSGTNLLIDWNLARGAVEKPVHTLNVSTATVISADNSKGITIGYDKGKMNLFETDLTKNEQPVIFPNPEGGDRIYVSGISSDSKYTFSSSFFYSGKDSPDRKGMEVYDMTTHQKILSFRNTIYAGAFAKTTDMLVVKAEKADPALSFYDVPSGRLLYTFTDANIQERPSEFLFSNSDRYLSIAYDRDLAIIDLTAKKYIAVANRAGGYVKAYAFTPDDKYLVLGSSEGDIDIYNIAMQKFITVGPFKAHVSGWLTGVLGINFSANGKYMFTSGGDKTVKVWDFATRTLIATLYSFADAGDWAVVTPDGHFDASPGAQESMYYVRGVNTIALADLYEKFYTPQLLVRLLNGEKMPAVNVDLNTIHPKPVVKIQYHEKERNLEVVADKPTFNNTTGIAELKISATAAQDKVDEIRLFQNGKVVNLATRGLFVTDNTGADSKTYTVNLQPGRNTFRALALNSQRTESKAEEITVNYITTSAQGNTPVPAYVNAGGFIAPVDKDATIHLIVVGINKYKNPKMSLNYALADATSFKNEAETDALTVTPNIKTYFITDDKADKNGILEAFKTVKQSAKPQDVLIFYYAGHGVISDKNKEFYLVPNDVTDLKNVDEALALHGIPSKILQQYAIDIAAQKQVFILDACQSAGAFATLLANDANQQKSLAVVARSTGTHWIAASGSQQFANEFSQLGHGAFTYVLLKAMKGEAASNKMVTINGLKNFLQVQVPDLMKKYNGTPQYPSSYGLGNDFPVGVIK